MANVNLEEMPGVAMFDLNVSPNRDDGDDGSQFEVSDREPSPRTTVESLVERVSVMLDDHDAEPPSEDQQGPLDRPSDADG